MTLSDDEEIEDFDQHPTMAKILKLRKCAMEGLYALFLNEFAACVTGKVKYRKLATKQLVRTIVSVTDEAFALLVLENR